jgi:TfoX-like protein
MKILRPAPGRPSQLKNLGPVSTKWLASVGVRRRADLIRMGPVEAYLKVKAAGHKPSLNLLWALAGAERGLRWNKLSEEDRHRLLLELDAAVAQHNRPRAK